MSILVVGSVGLDDVKTHVGKVENALGGSAIYFSTAASFFYDSIRLVAVVGDDFPQEHLDFLEARGIATRRFGTDRGWQNLPLGWGLY